MPARQKAKPSENKATPEKKAKQFSSPKKALEADHLAGKHKADGVEQIMYQRSANPDCGFCQRRVKRTTEKEQATKRYFASQKS